MPAKKFINQKDLAEIINSKKDFNLGKKQIEKIIKVLTDVITEQLKAGKTVKITSFGAFIPKTRYARGGVNPRSPQERIKIPTVKITKFKTGKKLKDALKG
ncbi:MAG: HU family DNA-binding protein [Patescibacteria group bacterium]|jgi:nucleoid DNA-binding protein